ncbi:MAG: UDP-N-acetylglucosamine 2-epimerase (non-hydrolyzing), partial [Flavobacteriales bacterium]|nr:UDP-N-acetylglucosamine 2-epimerase (non-hydrolyzing) [Flavobacteriales bacterium]
VVTRPNFIKITQFRKAAKELGVNVSIVHTGQHYDRFMSGVFFDQFNLHPDHFLALSSKTAAEQMGEMTQKLAELMQVLKPDVLMCPGDVNSTLAAALAANKLGIPIAHLEAGLRSFDRSMPEEINRILTDEISNHFFITEQSGWDNLIKEGKPSGNMHMVGNTMIDTLLGFEDQIDASDVLDQYSLKQGEFALMTMHRPSNVDNVEGLDFITKLIEEMTSKRKVVFPIHPRSKKRFIEFEKWDHLSQIKNLVITEPMGYFSFQKLIKCAELILTDSGGIQEESTFRQVPCFTLRDNTERPITIDIGTNQLVAPDLDQILNAIQNPKSGQIPDLWDGKATWRVLEALIQG